MTTAWRELGAPPVSGRPPPGWPARAVGIVVVVAALFVVGLVHLALVAGLLGTATLVVAWWSPRLAAHLDRLMRVVGHAVARLLALVLLGVVELFVFLPVSAIAKLTRKDPLNPSPLDGWSACHDDPARATHRPYAFESRRQRSQLQRGLHGAVTLTGVLLVLALLNYGLGWVWQQQTVTPSGSRVTTDIDAFASAPAMSSDEWAPAYWDEFRSLDYRFRPFILSRVSSVEGGDIRITGPVRRSFRPDRLAASAPVVWFLGGAALWGQGQRDHHTIPSEVARLADRDGQPIEAVNLGQPGYTSWQATLLLEQQLAVEPAPDLVVFYDGAADVAVQLESASDAPTHYGVSGVDADLTGRDSAREQLQEWWDLYRDTSISGRAAAALAGLFGGQPAGADSQSLTLRAADLHARSVDLAGFVAEQHGVEAVFVWQAASGVSGDDGAYRDIASEVGPGPPVLDLSTVLDDADEPVYLDGVLTNEQGAARVAAALWAQVRERLPARSR